MTSDDKVQTIRLIQPGMRWVMVLLVLFILVATAGIAAIFMSKLLDDAPSPPPYTVDLTRPEVGQTVAIEADYDRILAWVDGPNGRELRVFSMNSGRHLGTYKYPPKPSDK